MATPIQNALRDLLVRNAAIVAIFVGLDPDKLNLNEWCVVDILCKDGELKIVEDKYGSREIVRGGFTNINE